jgi:hypothetical protein
MIIPIKLDLINDITAVNRSNLMKSTSINAVKRQQIASNIMDANDGIIRVINRDVNTTIQKLVNDIIHS